MFFKNFRAFAARRVQKLKNNDRTNAFTLLKMTD